MVNVLVTMLIVLMVDGYFGAIHFYIFAMTLANGLDNKKPNKKGVSYYL